MKFLRTEAKIFLATFCSSLVVFFLALTLYFPATEPQFSPPMFSLWYVLNFFYGMSLFCLFIGAFSVLVYLFVRSLGNEAKIFVITFFAMLFGILGLMGTYGLFRGSAGNPFWMILLWRSEWIGYDLFILSFYFLAVSVIATIIYKTSTFVWRKTAEKKRKVKSHEK